ncbi:YbhB/YbcL family Raf kinase inhibitor-like protein [Egicoccus sp. AB-alg2]|uniref:YbhB/YbcL family Raf kinase inhibitor-like protein n=1 Tax=Egicoccus sp. AB-alg2 TaxID=3242693 RepID=UPI00359EAA71
MGLNIQDLAISSPEFEPLGRLEDRHANDKGNEQPTLRISGVPSDAVELAVVCHDPDAPLPDGFTHWLLYGLPADTTEVAPGADEQYRAGTNDFGEAGYGGPQPPPGHGPHHYYFWVYALSRPVEGSPSRREFLDTYADAIIEQNRVVGVYEN